MSYYFVLKNWSPGTMWFLLILSWFAILIQLLFVIISVAAGLYYLAELVEEYTVIAAKVIKYLIFVSIFSMKLSWFSGGPVSLINWFICLNVSVLYYNIHPAISTGGFNVLNDCFWSTWSTDSSEDSGQFPVHRLYICQVYLSHSSSHHQSLLGIFFFLQPFHPFLTRAWVLYDHVAYPVRVFDFTLCQRQSSTHCRS